MQIECPHCHSVFRVQPTVLEQADGQVRCGHCLAVFDAHNPLHRIQAETTSDIQLEFDTDDNVPFSAAWLNDDKEIIDEPIAADQENSQQHSVADVIPPELRAETRQKKNSYGFLRGLLFSIGILLCIAAGVLQYTYYNRAELVKITELRPWLEKACRLAKCTLPQPRDTRLFLLSSKNIFTHPNEKDALMISATIINQAQFSQAYPVIELRFADVRGQTIAVRRFSPNEYLGIPSEQITTITPGTPVSFNLEIKDPGDEMVSYEFEFL